MALLARRASTGLWLALALGACGGSGGSPLAAGGGSAGDGEVERWPDDADGDGLCDVTEEMAGTDPDAVNTDGDALPDLMEVAHNFNAVDPTIPAADQVAYLEAEPGASLDFTVRATVDGDGQGHTGQFRSQASLYGDDTGIQQFFAGSVAASADPADNVRGLEADASHFGSVLGSTRLTFTVHFQVPAGFEPPGCIRGYPFRYELTGDDGESHSWRQYLLVVGPTGAAAADVAWCDPVACY